MTTIDNVLPTAKDLQKKPALAEAEKAAETARCHLGPRGHRLKGQIVDFPGGMPGDIGFTLSWR